MTSVIATVLFLSVVFYLLTIGEATSRSHWKKGDFHTDALQSSMGRFFPSIEWGLESPPLAHAFGGLPMQSILPGTPQEAQPDSDKLEALNNLKEEYDTLARYTEEQYETMHTLADELTNKQLSKAETIEKNEELVETQKTWAQDQTDLSDKAREYRRNGGTYSDLYEPSYLDEDLPSVDSVTGGYDEAFQVTGKDMSSDEESEKESEKGSQEESKEESGNNDEE